TGGRTDVGPAEVWSALSEPACARSGERSTAVYCSLRLTRTRAHLGMLSTAGGSISSIDRTSFYSACLNQFDGDNLITYFDKRKLVFRLGRLRAISSDGVSVSWICQ